MKCSLYPRTCPECNLILELDEECASHYKRKAGKAVSWKPEVIADNSGKWVGNALRFATREEAEANVRALEMRWYAVRETRVVESEDAVNYKWTDNGLEAIEAGRVTDKGED